MAPWTTLVHKQKESSPTLLDLQFLSRRPKVRFERRGLTQGGALGPRLGELIPSPPQPAKYSLLFMYSCLQKRYRNNSLCGLQLCSEIKK